MDRDRNGGPEPVDGALHCGSNCANGCVGQEEGEELQEGVWGQVQEEETCHATGDILATPGDHTNHLHVLYDLLCDTELLYPPTIAFGSSSVHGARLPTPE